MEQSRLAELEAFVDESLSLSLAKKYPAIRFRQMRAELGTVKAMRTLAEADVLQTGLLELGKRGLLDWSVEAGVLLFPDIFTEKLTRASAEFKLEQARKSFSAPRT